MNVTGDPRAAVCYERGGEVLGVACVPCGTPALIEKPRVEGVSRIVPNIAPNREQRRARHV